MGSLMELEHHCGREMESITPTYFVSATELSLEGQQWLAKRTGGSFQKDPYYPDETVVYFARDETGLIFSTGRFTIQQKEKIPPRFYQDRRDHRSHEEKHSDAVVAFEPNGAVHIAWVVQSKSLRYGFSGITIMPGVNTKQIQVHEVQDLETADNSIISQAAWVAYEKMIGSGA